MRRCPTPCSSKSIPPRSTPTTRRSHENWMRSMTATVEGPTPLAAGFCFGEGPRWFEGLLWFSDMLGEAVHTVNLQGAMTTLPLPGHAPSGLGFRPDGSLLIASTENRQVLRYDGDTVTTLVDLSDIAPADLGDMVVDDLGRAYVGSQA